MWPLRFYFVRAIILGFCMGDLGLVLVKYLHLFGVDFEVAFRVWLVVCCLCECGSLCGMVVLFGYCLV